MKTNYFKGFVYGLITSSAFGLIPLFTLPLMKEGMCHDSILFYRFFVASFLLSGLLFLKKESFKIELKEIPTLLLLGFFYTASSLFLFSGYDFMSSGIATTLHFTYPIFTTLFMLFFYREKTNFVTLISVSLAVFGVSFMFARNSVGSSVSVFGIFIVILSAIAYALYIVAVNKSRVKNMNGLKLTFYVFLLSSFIFFIKAMFSGGIQPLQNSSSYINVILLAVVPTMISNIALVKAIHNIGGTLTSILGAMEPVTAVCVGILVFGDIFTINLAVGITLIIIAVTMIILSKQIMYSYSYLKNRLKGDL